MLKLPQKIKLGSEIITVKMVMPKTLQNHKEPSKEICYGDWNLEKLRIRVSKGLPDTLTLETLFHELKHGIEDFMGLVLPDTPLDYADALAKGELMLYRDNPELLKLLQKALGG